MTAARTAGRDAASGHATKSFMEPPVGDCTKFGMNFFKKIINSTVRASTT